MMNGNALIRIVYQHHFDVMVSLIEKLFTNNNNNKLIALDEDEMKLQYYHLYNF